MTHGLRVHRALKVGRRVWTGNHHTHPFNLHIPLDEWHAMEGVGILIAWEIVLGFRGITETAWESPLEL